MAGDRRRLESRCSEIGNVAGLHKILMLFLVRAK